MSHGTQFHASGLLDDIDVEFLSPEQHEKNAAATAFYESLFDSITLTHSARYGSNVLPKVEFSKGNFLSALRNYNERCNKLLKK